MKRARGEGHLYLRGRTWWIAFYSHVQQHRESANTDDERKARKLLRRRLAEIDAGVRPAPHSFTYEQARDLLYQHYKIRRLRSLRFDKQDGTPWLSSVRRLDGYFAAWRMWEIDTAAIRDFMENQQSKGLANASINRSLAALHKMIMLAVREHKLRNVPVFPERLDESDAIRQGFIESPAYETISQLLPDYLRLPLALGFFGGMRRGEVVGLTWNNVDFLNREIRLTPEQTKTKKGRTIPIVSPLMLLLEQQHSRRDPSFPFVCWRTEGGRPARLLDFRRAWETAVKSAGFPGLLFHDLRRSCVRSLVRSGLSRAVAMGVTRHATESVFRRYDITSSNDIRIARERLESFHEGEKNNHKTITISPESQNENKPVSVVN